MAYQVYAWSWNQCILVMFLRHSSSLNISPLQILKTQAEDILPVSLQRFVRNAITYSLHGIMLEIQIGFSM